MIVGNKCDMDHLREVLLPLLLFPLSTPLTPSHPHSHPLTPSHPLSPLHPGTHRNGKEVRGEVLHSLLRDLSKDEDERGGGLPGGGAADPEVQSREDKEEVQEGLQALSVCCHVGERKEERKEEEKKRCLWFF